MIYNKCPEFYYLIKFKYIHMRKDLKLIFFDMEGTIFKKAIPIGRTHVAPSAWMTIAKHLGKDALKEEIETQRKYKLGKYSGYIEWMEETILIHQKYGLKEKAFNGILDKIEYTHGVQDVFKKINSLGIPTCLISGGFKYQADKAVKDFKIKHSFVACEYFWNESGVLLHWNLLPADKKGKVDFMHLLMSEYGISKSNCAFIGDGENDVPIAKQVGISIAFNAQEELKKVATFVIDQNGQEDFKAVLHYLNI